MLHLEERYVSDLTCMVCGPKWNHDYNSDHRCLTCGHRLHTVDTLGLDIAKALERYADTMYRQLIHDLPHVNEMTSEQYHKYLEFKDKAGQIEQVAQWLRTDVKAGYTV